MPEEPHPYLKEPATPFGPFVSPTELRDELMQRATTLVQTLHTGDAGKLQWLALRLADEMVALACRVDATWHDLPRVGEQRETHTEGAADRAE